jgi:O-antigen/teichoic acid export membrane protein
MTARTLSQFLMPASRMTDGKIAPLSVRSNFSWTFAGNVVGAACSWMIFAVLARLGNSVAVGQFALGLAVSQPIMTFAQLHLRAIQATDARREYAFRDYLRLRLSTTALAMAAVAVIAACGSYSRETQWVVLLVGFGAACDSISDIFFGALQQRERMDRIAIAMASNGLLSVAGVSLAMWYTGSVAWGAAAWAGGSLAVLVLYTIPVGLRLVLRETDTPLWQSAGRSPGVLTMRRLIFLSLPMGTVALMNSLSVNIPRYFVVREIGESGLGIFAAAASLVAIGRTVVFALGQAASPRLARLWAVGDLKFYALLYKLVAVATAIGLVGFFAGAVAGRTLLHLLFGQEYSGHVDVFLWMLAGGGVSFVAACLGVGLTSARRFAVQMLVAGCTCMTCAIASALLVPRHGLRGAAIALLCTFSVQLAVTWMLFRRLTKTESRLEVDAAPVQPGTTAVEP